MSAIQNMQIKINTYIHRHTHTHTHIFHAFEQVLEAPVCQSVNRPKKLTCINTYIQTYTHIHAYTHLQWQ